MRPVAVSNQSITIRSCEICSWPQIAEVFLSARVTPLAGLLYVNPVSRVWTSSPLLGLDRVGDRWVASSYAADPGWGLGRDMLCQRGGISEPP